MSENNMINGLYDQVTKLNAGEGHIQFDGIKKDPKATAVISVYHGQRPSNKVLDDLYHWAESKGYGAILDKIQELDEMIPGEGES